MSKRGRRGNGHAKFGDQGGGDAITVVDEENNPIESEGHDYRADDDGQPDVEVVNAEDHRAGGQDGEDAYEALQKQFDDMKAAREAADARNRQYEQQSHASMQDQIATQRALIEHGIKSSKTQLSAAKAAFAQAMAAQDFEAAGDAQAAIAEAQVQGRQYEMARDRFDDAIKRMPKQAPQQADPVEATIQQLTPKSQEWARKNRETLFASPAAFQKAVGAHWSAISEGLEQDSDAYFAHIDKAMGLSGSPKARTSTRRPPMASAPVSRGTGVNGKVVMLTTAEREAASRFGMTADEYARYKKEISDRQDDPNFKLRLSANDPHIKQQIGG